MRLERRECSFSHGDTWIYSDEVGSSTLKGIEGIVRRADGSKSFDDYHPEILADGYIFCSRIKE